MGTKSSNKNLHKAGKAKKDEFYTQLVDIENELKYHKDQLRGKVVYCNCDDPFESNFFKYFAANFNALKLKKLITTSYVKSPIVGGQLPLFEIEGLKPKGKEPFKIEINEVSDVDSDGAIGLADIEWLLKHDANVAMPLKGDGDFRSSECVKLLKEADIVVTNPPFSLFREYVAQLMKYKKKFLIIGNINAITYKETFPLIKDNKMWIGESMNGSNRWFQIPDYYESYHKIENGKKYAFVAGVMWFTNFDTPKRHEKLTLYKKYTPKEYSHYDNYDAIDVSKVINIPIDWDGVIGVPISFVNKYNPDQFEIVALGNSRDNFTPNKFYIKAKKNMKNGDKLNGNAINCVLAINKIKKPIDTIYYTSDNSDYLVAPYARILIKNKKVKK